jgi:hypothetical protein
VVGRSDGSGLGISDGSRLGRSDEPGDGLNEGKMEGKEEGPGVGALLGLALVDAKGTA